MNEHTGFVKGKTYTVAEAIDYEECAIISKVITRKMTGSVKIMSFDKGTSLHEKAVAFETILFVIEGQAEVVIPEAGVNEKLVAGQSIIIPAHHPCSTLAGDRFKMLVIVIKSGYE